MASTQDSRMVHVADPSGSVIEIDLFEVEQAEADALRLVRLGELVAAMQADPEAHGVRPEDIAQIVAAALGSAPQRGLEAQRACALLVALQHASLSSTAAARQSEIAHATVKGDALLAAIPPERWLEALGAWQAAGFHRGIRKRVRGQRGGVDCCAIVARLLLACGAAGGTLPSVTRHVQRAVFG